MTPPVRKWVRRALHASALALAGCGPDVTNATAVECENYQPAFRGLDLPVIPDVIELRHDFNYSFYRSYEEEEGPYVYSRMGTPCATAEDKPACETAFNSLVPGGNLANGYSEKFAGMYIAITRGDEVSVIDTHAGLLGLLGPIDTPQEALIVAWSNRYHVQCGKKENGSAEEVEGGWRVLAVSALGCDFGSASQRHTLLVTPEGEVEELHSEMLRYGQDTCQIGRLPQGLSSRARRCSVALGDYFARTAHLEAASVPAFEVIHDELVAFGAPIALRRQALEAKADEVRHAHVTAGLARRFGGQVTAPCVEARPLRTLLDFAIDNAREGCVRETFGAAVGHFQAQHAADAQLRAEYASIARDETRHAELSWAIDAWVKTELSDDETREVEAQRHEAMRELRAQLQHAEAPEVQTAAGVPSPGIATRMFDALFAAARGFDRTRPVAPHCA